jgi:transposase
VTIPGVQRRTAEVLIAEIGVELSALPTPKHLASWAGVLLSAAVSGASILRLAPESRRLQ